MKRSIGILLVLVGTAFPLGCGGKADSNGDSQATVAARSASGAAGLVSPSEIVAMFSDSIRRGDKETTIKLITVAAREEIQRRGITIDPPGSPKSTFKIGEVKFIDSDRDAAYVESVWIEPGENGQPNLETEVVWAVNKEPEGWRISGLAIDMGPNVEPTLVDFEHLDVNVVETPANSPSDKVAGAPASPTSGGFQTPGPTTPNTATTYSIPATANPTAPSPNGFTMPDLAAPQLSQPPNTQFR